MNPLLSTTDFEYEKADAVGAAREEFARLLVSDIRKHGRADYELDGEKQTLTFDEIVEDWDDEMDAANTRFYMSRYDHDLKFMERSKQLHNEMNKHVEAMCMIVAEQVIN